MSRPICLILTLLALPGAAPAAFAGGAEAPAPVTALAASKAPEAAAAADGTAPELARDRMSPMVAELFAVLDEQRAKVARLRSELAGTRDEARALQLQRALSATKQETELRLLGVQADHARREGRLEVAARLEDAMRAMRSPAPVPADAAVARPAPVRAPGR